MKKHVSPINYLSAILAGLGFLCLLIGIKFPSATIAYGALFFFFLSIFIQLDTALNSVIENTFFTKLFTYPLIFFLFIYSSGQASSIINGIFGIDSSSFYFTKIILSSFIFIKTLTPFIIIVCALLSLWNFYYYSTEKEKDKEKEDIYDAIKWSNIASLIIVSPVFIIFYYSHLKDEDALKTRAYVLAHVLDFNGTSKCKNISLTDNYENKELRFIYFTPDYSLVLVDEINKIDLEDLQLFSKLKINVNSIRIERCKMTN